MKADEKGTEIEEIPPAFELEMIIFPSIYVRSIVRDLAIPDAHSARTIRLTAIHHKGT